MTKQEKIRRRVEKFVSKAYWYEGKKNVVVSITNEILSYLHSQDVVIRTDELPVITKKGWYHLVEPLIEDK